MHDTLEHAYQYAKAIHFEDAATADKVLCTRSPAIAKQLGSKVVNFDRTNWDCVKGTILMSLLRIKFADGTEMANSLKSTIGRSLAEAGRSKSFAIGISLNHNYIFDISKWSPNCNLHGKCLMEIRDELT